MTGSDRAVQAAAAGFATATVYTTVVAIRHELPGRPLGIEVPMSVSAGVAVGWGAAVAAPWPMPVVALVAARRLGSSDTAAPSVVCAAIGMAGIIGVLIEPNSFAPRKWAPATSAAIAAHVGSCAWLAWAGLGSWRQRRRASAAQRTGKTSVAKPPR